MGLNARQIQIIAGAIPKREYYYTSQLGRRLYDLSIGPFALSFVGVSDKDSIAQIKLLESKYGPYWIDEWLQLRGLNSAKYLPPHNKEQAA
jgi:type IV secretion system protein VirB4